MSDCESEISNPNVFTFQNVNTTISARGPYTNIKNVNFRNHHSSMSMPRNFELQKYAASVSEQRSMYYRRETSPMSIYSACDLRPRNFRHLYDENRSQPSVLRGRSGSPMSMRSIDSTASFSASDIAFAFRNIKYNAYDMQIIKDAYNKMMKQSFRKRIERRRNRRLFLKGSKHQSGDDSGEQGSDSSISSDDCRSVRTSYKENSSRTRTDMLVLKKTVDDRSLFSEKLKRHPLINMSTFNSNSFNKNHNTNKFLLAKQNHLTSSQINKLRNGFVLPSQRFNRSVASSVIQENSERNNKSIEHQNLQLDKLSHTSNRLHNSENGSDEEIFSNVNRTVAEKNSDKCTPENQTKKCSYIENHRKRSLDGNDDLSIPNKKKRKISPGKNSQLKNVPSKESNPLNLVNHNHFEFAKPILPVRKSKPKMQEKIIAKSKQPLTGFIEPIANNIANKPKENHSAHNQERANDIVVQIDHSDSLESSNVSVQPSFIKRKLFTQKLDTVYKQVNTSKDGIDSPQSNVYSSFQKEKNKTRKLVTTQSCLNRDVLEDHNLLDLIHKIVPPDSMNVTNVNKTNQTKPDVDKKVDDDDRWDVTSVISICNESDCSDTFTDEEIFKTGNKKKDTNKNKVKCGATDISKKHSMNANLKTNNEKKNVNRECSVVVENLTNCKGLQKSVDVKRLADMKNNNSLNANVGKSIISSARTFWDTDFESDMESPVTWAARNVQRMQAKDNKSQEASKSLLKQPDISCVSKNRTLETSACVNDTENNNIVNNASVKTVKLNINSLTVRSHRMSKKKKCCNESCSQEITPKTQVQNVHSTKINPSIESSKKTIDKIKTNVKNIKTPKIPTDAGKPKPNKQNLNNTRSTSHTRKSPRIKFLMNKTNKSIYQSPSNRPIRSCRSRSQNRSLL